MSYVDGFVFVVPRKNLAAYRKMAALGARIWLKHGALQYIEAAGDDLKVMKGLLSFPKLVRLKPGETVWFSFIRYRSKAHRDKVNAKVMKDSSMGQAPKEMPFDTKRMAYGGFKALVE